MAPKKRGPGRPFKKGDVPNPGGRKPVYEDFTTRAKHLLEKYTAGQIVDIVRAFPGTNLKTKADKDNYRRGRRMSARDFSIMISIASSFSGGGALPFTFLLDRAIGKVAQKVEIEHSAPADDADKKADQEAEEMMELLAKRDKAAKVVH